MTQNQAFNIILAIDPRAFTIGNSSSLYTTISQIIYNCYVTNLAFQYQRIIILRKATMAPMRTTHNQYFSEDEDYS